ncbi:hypothetical protein MNEG_8599 [Monoraphidium neglectum]|uniref:Uncharacterized protein n=1 Tax=Monoraphidium neglectum TaxID=145388 RepID=A0A0D2MYY2_9CHLO|nr:hypothetical protein MNEG_8599 [Monoraphidium neglectum]KIY99365.1 hypothetical protein MNEG_8599 [Monoraphidium neglectum]|eukprot:XP_013898385.1 hypothetical protein MNEG_8599 [Monoraphidium neglectum]
MNMVGRIGSGAASASEAIFGRTPSASSLSNQAGGPPSGSSAAAAAGGVAAPLDRRSPSPGPPGSAGAGARLSLAWVQEQFARGVAVTGSARGGTQPAAGARAALPSPLPPPAQQQQQQQQQQPASPFGSEAWPLGLPERLLLKRSLRLQAEPLSAVALTASPGSLGAHAGGGAPADGPGAAGGLACCVGHGGLLRVLGAPALGTLRSAKLQEDLLSLCLLPAAAAEKPHLASAAGPVGAPLLTQHHVHDVIMLAGSSNRRVLAFSPPAGRLLGSWAAHEDAVSCVARLGRGGGGGDTASGAGVRLVTASWDCSVKVWDVAEGRQPWDSSLPLAAAELRDFESGVWAVAGSGSGQLVVAGTEEGAVSAWDLRSRRQAWSTKVCGDYVGGLCLLPGGAYVAAVSADGAVRLLEWRRGGDVAVTARCAAPLRCCACDGRLLVAGGEAGQLHMWDVAAMTGQTRAAGAAAFATPGPDGFYPPLACESKAAVNSIAVCAAGGAAGAACLVAAAQEDGTLALFAA